MQDFKDLSPLLETVSMAGIGTKGSRIITGFTKHGIDQAISRGFKAKDILTIVREGRALPTAGRRYGSQIRYTLGNNTVIVNAQGKIVTLFSNAPGTAKGIGRGFFIR